MSCEAQIMDIRDQIDLYQTRIGNMQRMERELEQIFAENPDAAGMALFDNRETVMFLLNDILTQAESWSINFETVEKGDDSIMRRRISLDFSCSDYETARKILEDIHNNPSRCTLENLSVFLQTEQPDSMEDNEGFQWFTWEDIGNGYMEHGGSGDGDDSAESSDNGANDNTVSVSVTICFFEYQER